MKKLDLYIIKKFLGAFFFTVLLFIIISVVVDISEKMDDFMEGGVPFKEIVLGYYANFIPWIVFLLSPVFIFISVIFFTSQLAYRSEIIASLSSGISFYRLLLVPYAIGAFILFAIQYGANHYLVPISNQNRIDFELEWFSKKKSKRLGTQKDLHLQVAEDLYLFLGTYDRKDSTGVNFTLERVRDNMLEEKLSARRIRWRGEDETWELGSYTIRTMDGEEETFARGSKMDTAFAFLPKDLTTETYLKEAMITPRLKDYIKEQEAKGAPDIESLKVEQYRRTSIPFATFILTVIGFALASRKVRGGMGLHVLLGFGLSAAYVLMMQFSTTFAINGNLSPFLSVWIPNILFGILSIYLLKLAPK